MEKESYKNKIIHAVVTASLLLCLTSILITGVSSISIFNELTVQDFSTDNETVYKAAKIKEVFNDGTTQWKLTEPGEAVKSENGLTVPAGILALYKSNPLMSMKDFQIDIFYSTEGEDKEADKETAFVYASAEAYGKSLKLSDSSVLFSIAENGDVYYSGSKINHKKETSAGDVLTAANSKIESGDECVLRITYVNGKLSVSLTYNDGKTKAELVKNYVCDIQGVKQMQLGGDKSAAKRINNVTYDKIIFYEYGNYVPKEGTVAVVNSGDDYVEYSNADDALKAVSASVPDKGAVIELFSDANITKPVSLAKDSAFTLDLNGYTLNRNSGGRMTSDGYVFLLNEKSSLTVIDSSPKRENYSSSVLGGVIAGGAGDDVSGGIRLKKGSRLTMDGGSFVNCVTNDHGAAIRTEDTDVKISLKNTGFYTNMTCSSADNCHGGAIYVKHGGCELTLEDCIFYGNHSEDDGGAIYMNGGSLYASDCFFRENECLDNGGAVYLESGVYATLDNCIFRLNSAGKNGGAVYCNSNEGTRLSGKYTYNTANGSGGAVYVNGDSVCVSDCEIKRNNANGHGSGIYVDEMYDLNVQGLLLIRDNYNKDNLRDNVYLDDFISAEAHIYNGGLDSGSEIWIRTGDSDHTISENISEYQSKYFIQDDFSKSFKFTADESKAENLKLVTSAIGNGNLVTIIACIAVFIAATGVSVFVYGRKKRKKEESNSEK